MENQVSVCRAVAHVLRAFDVDWVFGVVGSGNFVVTNDLVDLGARFVAARHEAGALGMADGVYRSTGQLAVCSVHQGPGFTNTITALTEAAKSRSPLVLLTGATSEGSDRSNFEIDQETLARATGADVLTLTAEPSIVDQVIDAVDNAVRTKRPLVINMPLDVQGALVPIAETVARPIAVSDKKPSAEQLERLSRLINTSEKPLFIAGRGAWTSGSEERLAEVAERAGAVVATTAVVKGMAASSNTSVGISGGFSPDQAVQALEDADLIVGLGCSFTRWTTRSNTIFDDSTTVVQVDIDEAALGLNPRVDVEICADVATVLDALATGDLLQVTPPWFEPEDSPGAGAGPQLPVPSSEGVIHPRALTDALDALLPAERTLTIDGGHFIGWPATGLNVPDPSGFLFSSAGYQSIGLGLGMAIGAALARTDRLSVLVAGDGGFLMSIADLESAIRNDVPLLIVLYDDQAYGAEVHHFGPAGADVSIVRFPPTPIAEFVQALGGQACTITSIDQLDELRSWVDAPRGVFLVDAKIDPTIVGFWAEQDFLGH